MNEVLMYKTICDEKRNTFYCTKKLKCGENLSTRGKNTIHLCKIKKAPK